MLIEFVYTLNFGDRRLLELSIQLIPAIVSKIICLDNSNYLKDQTSIFQTNPINGKSLKSIDRAISIQGESPKWLSGQFHLLDRVSRINCSKHSNQASHSQVNCPNKPIINNRSYPVSIV